MKKKFKIISLLVCVMTLVLCLCACNYSYERYFLPEINSSVEEIKIEYVDNKEQDYVFPIEQFSKLDHSVYEESGWIDSAWLIKSDEKLLGWISVSGLALETKGDEVKYGLAPQKRDGKWVLDNTNVSVIILDENVSVFEHISFTANTGNVPFYDSYIQRDAEGKLVCVIGYYTIETADLDVDSIESIKLTMNVA